MNLFKKVLFFFYMLAVVPCSAQRFLGASTDEWNAMSRLYLNPANIADCREKISIGILAINFDVNNSLGTFSKLGEYAATSPKTFKISGTKDFNMMIPDVEVHGPGIMYSINKKHSLALTTGFRLMNQFNNFDPSLYKLMTDPGSVPGNSVSVNSKNFNWTANMWTEVGITYGAVILDNPKNEVKFGITLRKLFGIGYISVTGNNINVAYKADSNTVYATNTDLEFASNVVNDNTAIFKGLNESNILSRIFGANSGTGMSADIGLIYKRRIGESDPSDYMESDNTHDVVISASVTDFGSINYAKSTNADIVVTGNGSLTGPGISQNANSSASFLNYVKQQGFSADTESKGNRVFLPTALLVSADVQISGRFYGNLLYLNNLANRMNFGNSYYNQVTFTPRYDKHNMSIALPITYSMLSKDIKVGVGYRISGFFIGSDDALAFIHKNQHGFGLYLGGYIPIFKINHDPANIHWTY